jgi:hypothetical protein
MKLLPAACVVSLSLAAPALANSGGMTHQDCNACHSGGQVPTVTVTPSVQTVAPGGALSLVVSIGNVGNQSKGGFNLKASGGTLSSGENKVRMIGSEVTHTGAKNGSGGAVTFAVNWQAPATPGSYTFSTWGNAVNGTQGDNGDKAAFAQVSVTVTAGNGGVDAGTATDAGTDVDGGTDLDAGTDVDAGTEVDGGTDLDGGSAPGSDGGSAGETDAGSDTDGGAGSTLDGGSAGGGTDAGSDGDGGTPAGADAGSGNDDDLKGGCSAVGGSALSLVGLLALAGMARRRSRP